MFATLSAANCQLSLSPARMGAFHAHFKTTSDRECLGAMMWHHAIASSAWPLISVVEICLRNRSHHAMSALYGNVKSREWYRGGPNDMRLKGGIQGRITELLCRTDDAGNKVVNSIDEFIAATTFGTWVGVLQQLPSDRRFRFTKMAFPEYPMLLDKQAWTAPAKTWLPLIERLERHKSFRDRIAHHAPIWNFPYAPHEGEKRIKPASAGATIISLRQEIQHLRTSLVEMEPGLVDFWDGTAQQEALETLTTLASLNHYMGRDLSPPEAGLATTGTAAHTALKAAE